jgi:hypothetical protein
LKQLLQEDFQSLSVTAKQMLARARRITLCIDGWSTKCRTASYAGISACFFDAVSAKPVHAFLNLCNIEHPHTGQKLADCINHSLQQWGITDDKIILIVSDNGAKMLKAIKILQTEHAVFEDVEESESEDGNDDDKPNDEELELPQVAFRRMPCLVYTLQLIVKSAYVHCDGLIVKTRHMVGRIRKSSVAIEKLIQRCGRSVVTDVTTRWNSTFYMIQRLLSMMTCVNDVLSEMGMVCNSNFQTLICVQG